MKLYYVYIVVCSDHTLYTGVTSDLSRRLEEHNLGIKKDAYTYSRRPVMLKWLESFTDPNEAIRIEKQIKGWSRRKKKALINSDWDKLVLYSKNYKDYGKWSSTSSD